MDVSHAGGSILHDIDWVLLLYFFFPIFLLLICWNLIQFNYLVVFYSTNDILLIKEEDVNKEMFLYAVEAENGKSPYCKSRQ